MVSWRKLTIKPDNQKNNATLRLDGYYYTTDPYLSQTRDQAIYSKNINADVLYENGVRLSWSSSNFEELESDLLLGNIPPNHHGAWSRFDMRDSTLTVQEFKWSNGLFSKSAGVVERKCRVLNDSTYIMDNGKLKGSKQHVFQTYHFKYYPAKGDSTNWLMDEWIKNGR